MAGVCCPDLIEPASFCNTGYKGCWIGCVAQRGRPLHPSYNIVSRLRTRRRRKTAGSVDVRGFTVRRYGVFINSIQVEIADTIRDFEQKRLFFIEDLAFAIINFVRRHAPF